MVMQPVVARYILVQFRLERNNVNMKMILTLTLKLFVELK